MHGKRIEGTIAADYKDKTPEVVEKGKNSSEWRKQHEKMISAIREAKKNGPPINASEPTIEIKVWPVWTNKGSEAILIFRNESRMVIKKKIQCVTSLKTGSSLHNVPKKIDRIFGHGASAHLQLLLFIFVFLPK